MLTGKRKLLVPLSWIRHIDVDVAAMERAARTSLKAAMMMFRRAGAFAALARLAPFERCSIATPILAHFCPHSPWVRPRRQFFIVHVTINIPICRKE
jgi:hypothetical protein